MFAFDVRIHNTHLFYAIPCSRGSFNHYLPPNRAKVQAKIRMNPLEAMKPVYDPSKFKRAVKGMLKIGTYYMIRMSARAVRIATVSQ